MPTLISIAGDYEEAICRFQACDLDLLGNEERDEMTLHLALANIETGRLEEAYALLSVVQVCTKKYESDVAFHKAYIDYAQGRYTEALPVFQRLQDDDKYGIEAPYYIADIYLKQGKYKEAEQTADRYITIRQGNSHENELKRILGGAYYGQGRLDDALGALEIYVQTAEKQ